MCHDQGQHMSNYISTINALYHTRTFSLIACEFREAPSCRRCRQLGVECEGYGIRLSWVQYDPYEADNNSDDGQTTGTRASRRSLTHFATSSAPNLSSLQIDETLKQIDEWSPDERPRLDHAGFSVFPIAIGHQLGKDMVASACDRTELVALCKQGPPEAPFPPELLAPNPTNRAYEDRLVVDEEDSAVDGASDGDFHTVEDSTRTQGGPPGVSVGGRVSSAPPDCLGSASATTQTLPAISWRRDDLEPPGRISRSPREDAVASPVSHSHFPPRHLDVLSVPARQKRLIHHWVTFTSRKLVLLDEPHNPCRTMMLPMALKGVVSSSQESSANVAIFHAVCASAAFNLFELGGRASEQDQNLALYHDQQAIHHIRHNLARADEHQDQSFAMAIMACIAVEAISGTTMRWRTHVSGGLAYLAKLDASGVDERVLFPFRRHMVLMAILCDFAVPDNLKLFLEDDTLTQGLEFTFPYYGVSGSFLRSHDRMNTFALATATPLTRTPALEKELDAFELQLYLDFPGLPPPDLAAVTDTHGIVVHHLAKVFYYAGLVFFQRSIRGAPVGTVQPLVELGVAELETLGRVGKGELGCMMLWPVLVLGAECGRPDLQQKMRAWFRDQQKLGFRNLVVLEDLVATVWSSRAASLGGEEDVDWRDIIVQPPFDVFRL
ncbi:hypothetical protein GQ53DRAFT_740509 [Thozetella sp. PMI_491]|nr:hypothetical protein GQ53DRAFT_740509 [Thozetella sp. PMI_491]